MHKRISSFISFILCLFIANSAQAQLNANFSASVTTGCAPLIVSFTDQSTGTPTSYQWDFGNGSAISTVQNPTTSYTTPGTYTVKLTISNGTNTDVETKTGYITVYGPPVVNFTGTPLAGCPPLVVQFTDQSTPGTPGNATYTWNFGDGNSSTLKNPTHTFVNAGFYNITLSVENSQGCVKTETKTGYVNVYTPPVADFSIPAPVKCSAPAQITFTNNSTGTSPLTYQWNFGDGSPVSTAANPTHTYTTSGTYTITLIVTNGNGCKDTLTKTNSVSIGTLAANFTATSACPGDPVQFTNTTTPTFISSSWNFDGTGTSNIDNPTHSFPASGTYNVTLITSDGFCADTVVKPVTIQPKPNISFTAAPLPPCPAPVQVNFNNTTTGATTYEWDFGDFSGPNTTTSPSHTYNFPGTYHVKLIATSSFGCKDSLTKANYIEIGSFTMDANPDLPDGCVPHTVNFNPLITYTEPITSYTWNFGDGSPISNQQNPSHTYTAVGTYTAVLTIMTANNCTKSDTIEVNVGTPTTADFTASPTSVCVGEIVNFFNTSVNATDYEWYFGDGSGPITTMHATHVYVNSDTFTVTLIAKNNGCPDTMIKQDYIIVKPPYANFTVSYNCDDPKKVNFIKLPGDTFTSHLWKFGDGNTSTQLNPIHTYATLGSFTPKLIVTNANTGCTDSISAPVLLFDPEPTFSTPDTTICKDQTIWFTSGLTGNAGLPVGYTWFIGNSVFPDTTANIQYTFADTGRHKVKLQINDIHGCLDSAVKNNYVLVSKPYVEFTGTPLTGCAPMSVQFTDQTTLVNGTSIASKLWIFGDGGTSTVTTNPVNHVYNLKGGYDVKLKVTDNIGCTDSLTKQAYINTHKPTAFFIQSKGNACIGEAITFVSQSVDAVSHEWNFGDGTPVSTLTNPQHTYAQTGSYTVRLIVTDAQGCKDTLTKNNIVTISKPQAAFSISDTLIICPPHLVQFTNNSTNASTYYWDFGNSNTSIVPNPSNPYNNPAVYTVMLVAKDAAGCTDTATGTVNVLGYAGALTYTPLIGCSPLTVQFTANVQNIPTLAWDFGDGVLSTLNQPTISHTYTTPGAYVPKLIMSDNTGCQNSSTGIDTIKVDDVIPGFTSLAACVGSNVQFQDTSKGLFSAITTSTWKFHNGQTASGKNASQYYNAVGTYPVKLIVTNATGCIDSITRNVTINPLPTILGTGDTLICKGDGTQLLGNGGVSYTWTPAATLSCSSCPDPVATPTNPTYYIVTGTDANGCENTDSVFIDLKTKTDSEAGNGGEICEEESFNLIASGAHVYEWFPSGSLNNSTLPNPIATPLVSTNYMVVAKEGSCEADTNFVNVIVHPKPDITAGGEATIVAGKETFLQASGTNIVKFLWTPNENISCDTCADPIVRPLVTTTYTVIGFSDFGCTDSADVIVKVVCDEDQLFLPNTFTPNGDGQNDMFYPRGRGVNKIKSFRIYNRWGELVYERNGFTANDAMSGWDGTFKGTVQPPDVFVYIVEAYCESGDILTVKGDITLIR